MFKYISKKELKYLTIIYVVLTLFTCFYMVNTLNISLKDINPLFLIFDYIKLLFWYLILKGIYKVIRLIIATNKKKK